MSKKIETLPLNVFVNTVANMYFPPEADRPLEESWKQVIEFFKEDINEKIKVDNLLKELRVDRKFRSPIMLSEPDSYHLEENPSYKNHKNIVGNGTHRTVAYMLLAEEENNPKMPVEFWVWDESHKSDDDERYTYYETVVEFPENKLNDESVLDVMDMLFLSSPVSNGEWVEVEMVSAKENQQVILFWGNPRTNSFCLDEIHSLIYEALERNEVISDREEISIVSKTEEV